MDEVEFSASESDLLPPLAQPAQPLTYFQSSADSWGIVVRAVGVMAILAGGLQVITLILNPRSFFAAGGDLGIAMGLARAMQGIASALMLIAGVRLLVMPRSHTLLIVSAWAFIGFAILSRGLQLAWTIQLNHAPSSRTAQYAMSSTSPNTPLVVNLAIAIAQTSLLPAFLLYLITRPQAKRMFDGRR